MSDASHSQPGLAPASVYLLAEHLDAALAAGEDLHNIRHIWLGPSPREPEGIAKIRAGQRDTVERIRALELALLSRMLAGRKWADDLASKDESFSAMAGLYVSTTAILVDAVDECADSTAVDFDTGDGWTAYVRSRGLIAEDSPALSDDSPITIDDTFLVARRLRLGALLDLVAAFLDALEVEYNLFVECESSGEPVSVDQPAAAPVQ